MRAAMRPGLVAACLLLAPAALAQNPDDCGHGPFSLRPFPFRMVEAGAVAETKDPDNSFVGSVRALCEDGSRRVFVCGVVARRNRTGYIDRQRRFFGVYQADSGRFQITAMDRNAIAACNAKVYVQ